MGFWSDDERREAARARFEGAMAVPVLVAALLLATVTLVLLFIELDQSARRALIVVDGLLWAFFVFDYAVRFTLAVGKRRFLREEWVDGVLVILPFLQPLRLIAAFGRVARVGVALERSNRAALRLMGRHRLYVVVGWAAALMLTASIVVPVVEPSNGKIQSFGDGLWWAIVTTTTVGYGDLVPQSVAGRVIAAVLMVLGISIIGLLTANIASFLLDPDDVRADGGSGDEGPTDDEASLEDRLAELDRKVDELLRRLDAT